MPGVGGSGRRGESDLWTPRPQPPARVEPGKSPLSPGAALLPLREPGIFGGSEAVPGATPHLYPLIWGEFGIFEN